jgi:hypothetical protein
MKKVIRKGKYLYHIIWCRLYSDIVTVHLMKHHYDEFETYRSGGLTVNQSINFILYKYYPKWAEHVDKMIQYK